MAPPVLAAGSDAAAGCCMTDAMLDQIQSGRYAGLQFFFGTRPVRFLSWNIERGLKLAGLKLMRIDEAVINPQGEVVAEAISNFAYAVADVDLNQEWRQRYMSVGNGYGEPARFLVKERRPDTYEILQQDAVPDPDEVARGAR